MRSSRQQGDGDRLATPAGCYVNVENFTPAHAVIEIVRPGPCREADERADLLRDEDVESASGDVLLKGLGRATPRHRQRLAHVRLKEPS